jgi:hypothetical protein
MEVKKHNIIKKICKVVTREHRKLIRQYFRIHVKVVFWVVMPCGLIGGYEHSECTYCLHTDIYVELGLQSPLTHHEVTRFELI